MYPFGLWITTSVADCRVFQLIQRTEFEGWAVGGWVEFATMESKVVTMEFTVLFFLLKRLTWGLHGQRVDVL